MFRFVMLSVALCVTCCVKFCSASFGSFKFCGLCFWNVTFGTVLQLIYKAKQFLILPLPCNKLNNFLSRALLASFF